MCLDDGPTSDDVALEHMLALAATWWDQATTNPNTEALADLLLAR